MNETRGDETVRRAGGPYHAVAQFPVMMTMSVREDVRDRLDALAKRAGVSRSALLRELVDEPTSLLDLEVRYGVRRLRAPRAPRVEDGRTDNDV